MKSAKKILNRLVEDSFGGLYKNNSALIGKTKSEEETFVEMVDEWTREIEDEQKTFELGEGETDFFIFSLGIALIMFSSLLLSGKVIIPDPLFLGAAIFTIYFSIISGFLRKGFFKTIAISTIFPATLFLTLYILENVDHSISEINNALSLLALGISLLIMPRQKSWEELSFEKSKYTTRLLKRSLTLLKQKDDALKASERNLMLLRKELDQVKKEHDSILK